MNTIAISRLIGSNAAVIAQHLADELKYDLVDKKILEATLEQYGVTRFGKLYNSTPNLWDLANSKNIQVLSLLNDTMKALAYRGRTIVLARGAYSALADYDNVFKLRLQAPLSVRIDRMIGRVGWDLEREDVEARIIADDKARRKFVKLFYNKKYADATGFDLVVNTGLVPIETTEAWVLTAVQMLENRELSADANVVKQDDVDPLLLEAIDQSLQRRI
jgi:cytidylate kinase